MQLVMLLTITEVFLSIILTTRILMSKDTNRHYGIKSKVDLCARNHRIALLRLHIHIIVNIITLNENMSLIMTTETGCKPEESHKIQTHNVVIGSQVAALTPCVFIKNQDASAHILTPEIMAVT